MINSADKIWEQVGEINNLEFEYHYLGDDADIPVLIAKDVFKYPDKVVEFVNTLPFWETRNMTGDEIIRPGLTHEISGLLSHQFCYRLSKPVGKIFGVPRPRLFDVYLSATGGKMTLDQSGGLCCYPHTDSHPSQPAQETQNIALNINLTNHGAVKTGFWSWMNKKNLLDFNMDELNALNNFQNRHENVSATSWFQMRDYEEFKYEDAVTMPYNSLAAYSTYNLHNPVIEPDWFGTSDRLNFTAFYGILPEDLDFRDGDLEIVKASWDFFRLMTLHNYNPEYTRPV